MEFILYCFRPLPIALDVAFCSIFILLIADMPVVSIITLGGIADDPDYDIIWNNFAQKII